MANTKTNTQILTSPRCIRQYFTLNCVSNAQETNTVIYNASATITAMQSAGYPQISGGLAPTIQRIFYSSSSALGVVSLLWGATTNVVAFALPINGNFIEMDFSRHGYGLPSQAGSGATGNILMTTTGLASGDSMVLVLDIMPGWTEYR